MTEPVLHHYPFSPYAEKVRAMLGFKRIAWKSVQIPPVMPKPDVLALTGGYRKTPILQIGADIYCDTQCIIRELERRFPEPTLFPVALILRTLRSSFVVTQIAPSPKAIPLGVRSSGNVCVTRFAFGSIREIVPSPAATQIDPAPTAIGPGPVPTATCFLISFVFASINPAESVSMRARAFDPPAKRRAPPASNAATITPAIPAIPTRRRYQG